MSTNFMAVNEIKRQQLAVWLGFHYMHNILKDINRWRVLNTTKPKNWTNLAEASLVFYNLSEFRNLKFLNIFYLHTVCTMQFQHLNFPISSKD